MADAGDVVTDATEPWVPGLSGLQGVVRAQDAVAFIGHVRVWPHRVTFALTIYQRPGTDEITDLSFGLWPPAGSKPAAAELSVTESAGRRIDAAATSAGGPELRMGSGSGGAGVWSVDWTLAPWAGGDVQVSLSVPVLGLAGTVSLSSGDLAALEARATD